MVAPVTVTVTCTHTHTLTHPPHPQHTHRYVRLNRGRIKGAAGAEEATVAQSVLFQVPPPSKPPHSPTHPFLNPRNRPIPQPSRASTLKTLTFLNPRNPPIPHGKSSLSRSLNVGASLSIVGASMWAPQCTSLNVDASLSILGASVSMWVPPCHGGSLRVQEPHSALRVPPCPGT